MSFCVCPYSQSANIWHYRAGLLYTLLIGCEIAVISAQTLKASQWLSVCDWHRGSCIHPPFYTFDYNPVQTDVQCIVQSFIRSLQSAAKLQSITITSLLLPLMSNDALSGSVASQSQLWYSSWPHHTSSSRFQDSHWHSEKPEEFTHHCMDMTTQHQEDCKKVLFATTYFVGMIRLIKSDISYNNWLLQLTQPSLR